MLCSLPVFYLGPNCGGGNEDNGDLLKGPMHPLLHAVPRPCSRPPPTHASAGDVDTHRQVWVGLLWGRCSFLLGPGVHMILFVFSKSLFPQSCVNSGSSVVELMAASLMRAYAIPRSAAPSAPAPAAGRCRPTPPPETPGCSRASLGQSLVRPVLLSPGSWCAQGFVCAL